MLLAAITISCVCYRRYLFALKIKRHNVHATEIIMTTSEEEGKYTITKETPDKESGNYHIPTALSTQDHLNDNKIANLKHTNFTNFTTATFGSIKNKVLPDSDTDQNNNEDPFKGCEAIIPEVDSESSGTMRKSVRSVKSKKSTI